MYMVNLEDCLVVCMSVTTLATTCMYLHKKVNQACMYLILATFIDNFHPFLLLGQLSMDRRQRWLIFQKI